MEYQRCKIKKGVKGKAYIIVPISESMPDRIMFNDAVEHIFNRDVENEQELEQAYEFMIKIQDKMTDEDKVTPTTKGMKEYHKELIKRVEKL